jgi:hypothetical protein
MGTAWEQHGNGMVCVNPPLRLCSVWCAELNTQQTAASGNWRTQWHSNTLQTVAVCFLYNVRPEVKGLTHAVKIRAVLVSKVRYIV